MSPIRLSIFGARTDAHLRLRWISQQEIGKRVAGARPLGGIRTVVGVDASCVVWKRRIEIKVEEIGAELNAMTAAMDQHIIEQFKISIEPRSETRRRSNRAKSIAQRH